VGRVSTFADAEVIKMATTEFVPVCTDDWYTRRRTDAEGEFFRTMADAGGRKSVNGGTRQGIYVFAADGTPLGYKNAGQDAEVMKKVFKDALAKFEALAKRGHAIPNFKTPDGADKKVADQEFQKGELERSIKYLREQIGLGLKA